MLHFIFDLNFNQIPRPLLSYTFFLSISRTFATDLWAEKNHDISEKKKIIFQLRFGKMKSWSKTINKIDQAVEIQMKLFQRNK